METYFRPVSDNLEKQKTFRNLMGDYNRAVRNHFYYEAIMIDYALIEDRLRSCIYYLGLLADRQASKVPNNRAKKAVKNWMQTFYPEEQPNFRITTFAGKQRIIETTFLWFLSDAPLDEQNPFECALRKVYLRKNVNIPEALQWVDKCDQWRIRRNELTHALFNKQMNELKEQLEQIAKEGKEIARYIDKISSWIGWHDEIRTSLRLKTEHERQQPSEQS